MALEINCKNNTYLIKGTLNYANVKQFQSHFSEFMQQQEVVINIDQLQSVDTVGVAAFEELYKQLYKQQKTLQIIGYGCRDMHDHLNSVSVV